MPRSANTTAEKKAVRVRNSIARSLRAMRSAAASVLGAMRHVLAIDGEIRRWVDGVALVEADERAVVHDGRVRRERESVGDLMRDEHHRRAGGSQGGEMRTQRRAAGVVEAGERFVEQHHSWIVHGGARDRYALLHAAAQ